MLKGFLNGGTKYSSEDAINCFYSDGVQWNSVERFLDDVETHVESVHLVPFDSGWDGSSVATINWST